MDTKTFPIEGPIKVVGRVGHGSFTVRAQDDCEEATVTLAPRNTSGGGGSDFRQRTVVELRGTALVVVTPRQGGVFDLGLLGGRGRRYDAMDVTVTVPSGTPVKVSAFTADITLDRPHRDHRRGRRVARRSPSTHVDGDLRLRYGSGSARVGRVTGSVQARSGSGDATFGEIGGVAVGRLRQRRPGGGRDPRFGAQPGRGRLGLARCGLRRRRPGSRLGRDHASGCRPARPPGWT